MRSKQKNPKSERVNGEEIVSYECPTCASRFVVGRPEYGKKIKSTFSVYCSNACRQKACRERGKNLPIRTAIRQEALEFEKRQKGSRGSDS